MTPLHKFTSSEIASEIRAEDHSVMHFHAPENWEEVTEELLAMGIYAELVDAWDPELLVRVSRLVVSTSDIETRKFASLLEREADNEESNYQDWLNTGVRHA